MPLSETTPRTHAPLHDTPTTGRATALDWVALVLMIVGGLNWGLVGLFQFDLVAAIFGTMTGAARAVYTLVGIAAVYGLVIAARWASR
ncbi:MAG: DUF378 domain-containing protein [Rubrivivax sp.]|nr:MAG: DUF378 domain-containing protein [Rubrivivax sp.]